MVFNCDCLNYQNNWYFGFYLYRILAFRADEHFAGCLPDFYLCLTISKTNNGNMGLSNRIKFKRSISLSEKFIDDFLS